MAGWVLPAASLLGAIYAGSRGDGGGSEFSPQQERLFDTQADIAEMMKGLYESRIANEEQYLGDAMSRVFQYADRMQNRSPDLLNAPGTGGSRRRSWAGRQDGYGLVGLDK